MISLSELSVVLVYIQGFVTLACIQTAIRSFKTGEVFVSDFILYGGSIMICILTVVLIFLP